jgi:hypothetical protein
LTEDDAVTVNGDNFRIFESNTLCDVEGVVTHDFFANDSPLDTVENLKTFEFTRAFGVVGELLDVDENAELGDGLKTDSEVTILNFFVTSDDFSGAFLPVSALFGTFTVIGVVRFCETVEKNVLVDGDGGLTDVDGCWNSFIFDVDAGLTTAGGG